MATLLRIYFTDVKQLYPIHEWQIRKRIDCDIVYTRSNRFQMLLFESGRLVWRSDRVKDLYNLDIKSGNADFCGVSGSPETRHCFRDETHRTCCLLGHAARRYSDRSGNPIGTAAERVFYEKHGFYPDKNTLTPWCTCIGSGVCTYYQSRLGDGTHIKYIDVDGHKVVDRRENKYRTIIHRTPGVN